MSAHWVESFGKASGSLPFGLSPYPSPSWSAHWVISLGKASFESIVPSPSVSTSIIRTLSGHVSVIPKSLPSYGVTVTVHVSPTEVAESGNSFKSS